MAVRSFFAVRPPADWRRRLTGVGLIVLGLVGVGVAGWAYFDAWTTRQGWEASPEAAALARQSAEPTPIWIAASTPEPAAARIEPLPAPEPAAAPLPLPVVVVPTPTATATADQLSLDTADFRFLRAADVCGRQFLDWLSARLPISDFAQSRFAAGNRR